MTPVNVWAWTLLGVAVRPAIPASMRRIGLIRSGAWTGRHGLVHVSACAAILAWLLGADVWGMRLACLTIGIAVGGRLPSPPHASGRPDRDGTGARNLPGRVSYGPMEDDEIEVRPFLKDNGPFAGMPSRFLGRGWKRVPDERGLPERSTVLRRMGLVFVVGRVTGLSACIGYGRPAEHPAIRMMATRILPYPDWTCRTRGADPGMFADACMLRYGADVLTRLSRDACRDAHPRLACLVMRCRCAPIRRALAHADRFNPLIGANGWGEDIGLACELYDATLREYGPVGAVRRLADLIGGFRRTVRG